MSLNKLKTRMLAVDSISKTTKAMKSIASVKLKKMQHTFEEIEKNFADLVKKKDVYIRSMGYDIDLYPENLRYILLNSFSKNEAYKGMNINSDSDVYFLCASARGLCGSFFNKFFSDFSTHIKRKYNTNDISAISNKIFIITNSDMVVNKLISSKINNYIKIESVDEKLLNYLISSYANKQLGSITLLYSHFINTMKYETRVESIFPFNKCKATTHRLYIGEEEFCDFIKNFYSRLLNFALYSTSFSENASRLVAMDSASTNASNLYNHIKLKYNKLRQSIVTAELIEIVSGAESFQE